MPLTSTSTRTVQFGSTKYIYMSHIIFLQKMITLLWGKKGGKEEKKKKKRRKKKENEGRKKEKNSVSSASLGGNFHS